MPLDTLCDLFYHSVDQFDRPDHLRVKRDGAWRAIDSAEFKRSVEELSMALRHLAVERGDRIAILCENRPEWAYADLASLCAGAVVAPIYATLTPSQVLYILNDSGARVLFVSGPAQAAKLTAIRAQAPQLEIVIQIEGPPAEGVLSLAEVQRQGREALARDTSAVRDAQRRCERATWLRSSTPRGPPAIPRA
jgi:long-chain acyl-CoA synthetase